jgi:pSer/pThr/pTyr-binding forkhead associated (FHA) protein
LKVTLKIKTPTKESQFEVTDKEVIVGRGEEANIRVRDENCSRQHVKLYVKNQALWVKDLKSKNGTYVNGVSRTMCKLYLNDEIKIGDCEITVCKEENITDVIKMLKPSGDTDNVSNLRLLIDEPTDLNEVRINPLTALKNPKNRSRESLESLDRNPLFKDSRSKVYTVHTKVMQKPNTVPNWKYQSAWLIDMTIYFIALGAPIYLYLSSQGIPLSLEGINSQLTHEDFHWTLGIALGLAGVVWFKNNKTGGGSFGERIMGLVKDD